MILFCTALSILTIKTSKCCHYFIISKNYRKCQSILLKKENFMNLNIMLDF